ncbi:NUDIX domain-containing protein [Candidatus Woesearchaeota archaeon]|nr:NUDIX domain-containing protein [Candidatus Woesearchaeota archaeon]
MAENIGIRPATIVIKDKKVLLVGSKYKEEEFYLFPGGGMEFGETIEEAAVRETFEETGVKVKIKDLFHVNEYIYAGDWNKRSVSMFFIAEVIEISEPTTNDDGKIKEVKWIKLSELDNYDVKPKRIAAMLKLSSNLDNKREMYSIDFKK